MTCTSDTRGCIFICCSFTFAYIYICFQLKGSFTADSLWLTLLFHTYLIKLWSTSKENTAQKVKSRLMWRTTLIMRNMFLHKNGWKKTVMTYKSVPGDRPISGERMRILHYNCKRGKFLKKLYIIYLLPLGERLYGRDYSGGHLHKAVFINSFAVRGHLIKRMKIIFMCSGHSHYSRNSGLR